MTTAEILTVAPDPGAAGAMDGALPVARVLERHGLPVRERRVVGAEESLVERSLRQAMEPGGLVVVLAEGDGGVVARGALARVVGSRLVLSDRAFDALAAAYTRRGQAMPRRAEGLALVPNGGTVLVAAEGGEPGLLLEASGALVAILSAPPIALSLLVDHVLPRVPRRGTDPVTMSRTLRVVGVDLAEAEATLGPVLQGASGVSGRVVDAGEEVWVRLRLVGPTAALAEAAFRAVEPALRAALGDAWYGEDDERLEAVVGRLLRARGLTVALAESCTGGLVAHRLTQIAGSSAYFERGLVVYSNAAKEVLLGVPADVLARHGAVSRECAEAMARGVRSRAGTDLGVSITGIAGPDGGTPTKPVGTVFVGLADAGTATVEHYRFDRDREGNKALSAVRALDCLRRYCLAAP